MTTIPEESLSDQRIRALVTRAALRAARAATAPGLAPEDRMTTLMECHGIVLAAHGPSASMPFSDFRGLLIGTVAGLLPDGIAPDGLEHVSLLDDGLESAGLFDLDFEQRLVLRAVRHTDGLPGIMTDQQLVDEIDQELVYEAMKKGGKQDRYELYRSNLIRYPSGSVDDIAALALPEAARGAYREISLDSRFHDWWYPCPACRWPMRVTAAANGRKDGGHGVVRCWYAPHADLGASYGFRLPDDGSAPVLVPQRPARRRPPRELVLVPTLGDPPRALPVDDHRALARGVWRYTTVPGLIELALHDRLKERGLGVDLWPGLDLFDLRITVLGGGPGPDDGVKVDVKDYTSGMTLGQLVHSQEGDKGGAEVLVVPDHRADQVPLLQNVCAKYGMRAEAATDFAESICQKAGISWL
ncbi:hypothetical protein L1785_18790 [Antribacter sp. KLBMP9083]|uniref:REase associating with pPIWI RE domain-containing protein n=1 Tax=Antribacter soli TaxID=2910976 RepID=A0AA41QIV7_9MICO|nr:hypothetical protein [Antribacter soli]MCF4123027.1 hypothetical protein [Antribacter soli]